MRNFKDKITNIQASVSPICAKYDVSWLGLFGSYVRGEETTESDINLLVEFSKRKSLLTLVRFERELTELLSNKVDLLTKNALNPYLKDQILNEVKVLYEA